MDMQTFVRDFAAGLKMADARGPSATNARSKLVFQPGIGPHSEAETIRLVVDELTAFEPAKYKGVISLGVSYPDVQRQKCDLCLGADGDWEWAIEIKLLRFLGDNGKLNDNILMHILSPYHQHRSALTDCVKLSRSSIARHKAIMIYGFENKDWPLGPAIEAFERLATAHVSLGPKCCSEFSQLIHPVHSRGMVFGWEIEPR